MLIHFKRLSKREEDLKLYIRKITVNWSSQELKHPKKWHELKYQRNSCEVCDSNLMPIIFCKSAMGRKASKHKIISFHYYTEKMFWYGVPKKS